VLVDVRDQGEWDGGHVSCAHRLPVQDDATLVRRGARTLLALGVKVILTPPCIFH
jgi:rhodanese-related sulfurtransferase